MIDEIREAEKETAHQRDLQNLAWRRVKSNYR